MIHNTTNDGFWWTFQHYQQGTYLLSQWHKHSFLSTLPTLHQQLNFVDQFSHVYPEVSHMKDIEEAGL